MIDTPKTRHRTRNRQERKRLDERGCDMVLGLNDAQAKIINAVLQRGLHGNTAAGCVHRLLDESLAKYEYLVKDNDAARTTPPIS